MNILLTNDDGFDSVGIRLLKKLLSPYGRVVICAPRYHMSAKSCSITFGRGQELTNPEKDVFALDGTPADCVSFALSMLDIDFDLVVSGCNAGWNISFDINYSGTIGAGIEALTFRKKVIAVSCPLNYGIVEKHFDEVFRFISEKGLISDSYLLNINFPEGETVRGIETGSLYYCHMNKFFEKKEDGYWAYRDGNDYEKAPPGTDVYQVHHGIVSVVPLDRTYYSPDILRKK